MQFVRPLSRTFCSIQQPVKHVLVYGGNGALGKSIVDIFQKKGWNSTSVDFSENNNAKNNILLSGAGWSEDTDEVRVHLQKKCQLYDVIVNAAGGWIGGTIKDTNVFDAFSTSIDQNVKSTVSAAHLAASLLTPTGLLVLTGAAPVHADPLSCTGMLAYGSSKASVHFLVKSLASEESGLPPESSVVGILPSTIDTPTNRSAMPSADFDTWTKPSVFAKCIIHWAEHPSYPSLSVPKKSDSTATRFPKLINGKLYEFKTIKAGMSITDFVDLHEVCYQYKG